MDKKSIVKYMNKKGYEFFNEESLTYFLNCKGFPNDANLSESKIDKWVSRNDDVLLEYFSNIEAKRLLRESLSL